MKILHLLKLVGVALFFMVVNVGVSFLVVAFYAYFINPGEPPEFYEAFAQAAAPYSSIFAGMPLLFFIIWWICRDLDRPMAVKSAIVIWAVYTVIDLAVVFSVGMTSKLAILVAISTLTKLGAAWMGARVGSRKLEYS